MSSTKELIKIIRESEVTSDFELQKLIIDYTEDICEEMQKQGIKKKELDEKTNYEKGSLKYILKGNLIFIKDLVYYYHALGYRIKIVKEPLDYPVEK